MWVLFGSSAVIAYVQMHVLHCFSLNKTPDHDVDQYNPNQSFFFLLTTSRNMVKSWQPNTLWITHMNVMSYLNEVG